MYSPPGTSGDECVRWDNGRTVNEEAYKVPLYLARKGRGVVYDTGDLQDLPPHWQ